MIVLGDSDVCVINKHVRKNEVLSDFSLINFAFALVFVFVSYGDLEVLIYEAEVILEWNGFCVCDLKRWLVCPLCSLFMCFEVYKKSLDKF